MRATALLVGALLGGCTSDVGPPPAGATAAECGACHPVQHEEWSASRHASSGRSPVYTAMLPAVREAWGAGAEARCVGCHEPAHSDDRVITCVSCHAAVGNRRTADGALVLDTTLPPAGPFGDGEPPHGARPSTFLSAPELCGTCHQVTGPALFDEPTYDEYLASPVAEVGLGCADCHMPSLPAAPIADGAPRSRRRRSHRFDGVDPAWGAGPEARRDAEARAAALLAEALSLRVEPAPDGFDVVLENTGAGHHVPTGLGLLRDLWVDVVVDGDPYPRVLELGHRPTRNGAPVPLPTQADGFEPRALAPGEQLRARVGGREVEATLRARAVRHDALEALGLGALRPEVPTLDVEVARPR